MKVSFDWDSTLSRSPVQEYAKEIIDRGVDVWIITSRYDDEHLKEKFQMKPQYAFMGNKDLYEGAEELNIPLEKVIFTNFIDKYQFIEGKDFIWHLDDDWEENNLVNKYTKTVGISSISPNWKDKCEKILKINMK